MNKINMGLVLLFGLLLSGCSSTPPTPIEIQEDLPGVDSVSQGGGGPSIGLYRLRALDPLVITLLGIPEEKQLDEVIDEQGMIMIPYIETPIPAAGMTTSELEREIERVYTDGEIYRDITVNVLTAAKTYFMEGEVERPKEYPLNRRVTLLQAIAAASGYTDYANKAKITITRNGQIMRFNAKDIEKYPERDIPVQAGDRIKVHRLWY